MTRIKVRTDWNPEPDIPNVIYANIDIRMHRGAEFKFHYLNDVVQIFKCHLRFKCLKKQCKK